MSNRLKELAERAIALLRMCQPKNGVYYGLFSGGKDSCVIKHLTKVAGVPVEWHYNVTTIDPPELLTFIRQHHHDVLWNKPTRGFFSWFRTQGFPTRRQRWCCRHLKEQRTPKGKTTILGVRGCESPRRAKNWRQLTYHTTNHAYSVCPIVDWTDYDVWGYIRQNEVPYCLLYDEGFTRLGCIGCPMGGREQRKRQFARWPKFEAAWKRAFQVLWSLKTGTTGKTGKRWFGDRYFDSAEELYEWWLSDEPVPEEHECQGFVELLS